MTQGSRVRARGGRAYDTIAHSTTRGMQGTRSICLRRQATYHSYQYHTRSTAASSELSFLLLQTILCRRIAFILLTVLACFTSLIIVFRRCVDKTTNSTLALIDKDNDICVAPQSRRPPCTLPLAARRVICIGKCSKVWQSRCVSISRIPFSK